MSIHSFSKFTICMRLTFFLNHLLPFYTRWKDVISRHRGHTMVCANGIGEPFIFRIKLPQKPRLHERKNWRSSPRRPLEKVFTTMCFRRQLPIDHPFPLTRHNWKRQMRTRVECNRQRILHLQQRWCPHPHPLMQNKHPLQTSCHWSTF